MSDIVITPVASRGDLKKFIAFPNRLFKDVPSYIPPLDSEERKLLTDKNPSLEHCSRELFLARRGGKVVGRVAAIINRTVNEHWNKRAVRFGWFDFVEDYDVFLALLDKVVDYGRRHGMDEIEGPFGFTDLDKECWAIDNFDARQNMSTLYNPEYYIRFIERAGYDIKCRWRQYVMPASQPVPDKVARLNGLIMEKYHLTLLKPKNRKEIYPYATKFFHTLNDSFKDLYDFVPLTEKEIDVAPFIVNGSTMIPLRGLLEEMGAEIGWNGQNKTVTVNNGINVITLQIWNYNVSVTNTKYGDVVYSLLKPPIISDSRTFIPIRFVSEQLGYNVSWDGETQTVTITK